MKSILELLPIGTGVALVSLLAWFLLDRNPGLGKWLLAGLILAHGWVHMMFLFPAPEAASASAGALAYPFDLGRSWLITNAGLDAAFVRMLGIALMLATFGGFVLAALATVGWLVPAGWWGALVAGSAVSSTLLLIVAFSPALLLGFGINAALWWLVLASIWSPAGRLAGGGLA